MKIIDQISEFFKRPEVLYYSIGSLVIIILLYFLFKKKKTSTTSFSFDSLIRNFLSIVVVGVLTLQILLGVRKSKADNLIKKDIDDNKNKKKDLDKLRNDIDDEISDKKKSIEDIEREINRIEKEKESITKEGKKDKKSLEDMSKKLKNL
mgnify:CR=1 FL=1